MVTRCNRLGGESPKAAQLAAKQAGFNTVLFVKGGCDGNRGWRESELPWKEPIKIDLDFVKVTHNAMAGEFCHSYQIID